LNAVALPDWPHILADASPITPSRKELIQTMPGEGALKLAPKSDEVKTFSAEVATRLQPSSE
jgi:hypothetical protein